MIETTISIPTPDGVSDSVFIHPEGPGPWPGVLYLTDIGGIRPAYHEMAGRLAQEGYAVLMPNVFYRTSKVPLFDFKPVLGDERTAQRFAELGAPVTPEAMERDASVYVDWLAGDALARQFVRPGGIGVVGYCFTGAMALRAAAARPDKIVAAASFHGGLLCTDKPTSPHLVLQRVRKGARLYFGHATNDRSMPAEAIEKFNAALRTWKANQGGTYESEVYNATHGWTTVGGAVYSQAEAERAYAKLVELFRKALTAHQRG